MSLLRAGLLTLLCSGACSGGSGPPQTDAGNCAMVVDAGAKAFGAACACDGECASGHCFIGGAMQFCTMPCTTATQASDCPSPPTSGTCNMRGFCKP